MERMVTPKLEDLTELEMNLPLRVFMTEDVGAIKAVAEVDTERSKWSDE
jgi:hypothetical protein